MALTATRITDGFEPVYNKVMQQIPNPVKYELTPGTAFAKGDVVVLTNGKVAKASAGATNVLGVMAQSVTATQNPAGATTYGDVYDQPQNVYRCTFTGHRDATATGGSTTTLVDSTMGAAADDRWAGALLYVYEGAGAGSIRTVKAYTSATRTLTVEQPFAVAIDTTSKYILLGNASAAGDVINVGSYGVNLSGANRIAAGGTVASEAGPLVVTAINPAKLTMDVVIRKHLFHT